MSSVEESVLTCKALNVDDRHRVVLKECPAGSVVTVTRLDDETWVVRRHQPERNWKAVYFRPLAKLADDGEWQAVESRVAREMIKGVNPPEF